MFGCVLTTENKRIWIPVLPVLVGCHETRHCAPHTEIWRGKRCEEALDGIYS